MAQSAKTERTRSNGKGARGGKGFPESKEGKGAGLPSENEAKCPEKYQIHLHEDHHPPSSRMLLREHYWNDHDPNKTEEERRHENSGESVVESKKTSGFQDKQSAKTLYTSRITTAQNVCEKEEQGSK